jgi:hypothetical protein
MNGTIAEAYEVRDALTPLHQLELGVIAVGQPRA